MEALYVRGWTIERVTVSAAGAESADGEEAPVLNALSAESPINDLSAVRQGNFLSVLIGHKSVVI